MDNVSINACGRFISDPDKSDLDYRIARDTRFRASNRPELNVTDKKLSDSVCVRYYDSKDVTQITPTCRACINKTAENDIDCSCIWDKNFCTYARCVANEYKQNKQCINSYQALFNTDDFKDSEFRSEITPDQLKHCDIFADEHFYKSDINLDPSNSVSVTENNNSLLWILVFLFVFIVVVFVISKLLRMYVERKKLNNYVAL